MAVFYCLDIYQFSHRMGIWIINIVDCRLWYPWLSLLSSHLHSNLNGAIAFLGSHFNAAHSLLTRVPLSTPFPNSLAYIQIAAGLLICVLPAAFKKICSNRQGHVTGTGLLNSPKTKMINGIMLVVFPYPFVQVSLWRCNLETTDWIVVPGAWVPNPPNADGCTPAAFWGLGFGKVKALVRKPRHQHLLVGDPLNSVG